MTEKTQPTQLPKLPETVKRLGNDKKLVINEDGQREIVRRLPVTDDAGRDIWRSIVRRIK